ncbi:MAG: hypothetical protein LBK27_08320 [Treponema sp.]|jgi:hypothetical protein|nr:hypothetical protein [Treponema sp.]
MRRTRFLAPGVLVFLALLSGKAYTLDLHILGGLGNLAFEPGLEASLGAAGTRFNPHLFPLGLISLEGKFSELADFAFTYERDPLLQNRLLASVGVHFGAAKLDFGPFIGLFNGGGQFLNPGVAAALGFEFPGILFGSLEAASSIGSLAALPGEYLQQTGEVSLGFWVPYVVCTLSVNTRAFTQRKSDTLLIKDERTRYQFRADVFTKNVPYTVYIDLGYQAVRRSYIPSVGASAGDELKSLYAGFETSFRVHPAFRLLLGAEMPVYAWGDYPLKGPDRSVFLYEFRMGLIWTLPGKK